MENTLSSSIVVLILYERQDKSMKKKILGICMSFIILMMAVPVSARNIANFDFSGVVYDWQYGSIQHGATWEELKTSTTQGVVNTTQTAGHDGGVSPSQNFNVIVGVQEDPGPFTRYGHIWNVKPYTRTLISYYDASKAKGQGITMMISLRTEGAKAHIWGSWSPDTK